MLKKLINKIEETYVFNISQFFWHIFVAIAGVGIIGGIAVFLWGLFPAFKSSVEKEQYPPVAGVSLDELTAFINPPKKTERGTARQQQQPQVFTPPVSTGSSSEELAYRASLDTMQMLIPPAKYNWGAEGHWDYPYGPNYPQYARWVAGDPSVLDRLESAFSSAGISTFTEKKQLLDAHIAVVRPLKEEFRMQVWKSLINWSGQNLTQALANVRVLAALQPRFPADRYDHITKLAQFGTKNPKDGYAFVEYVSKTIDKFNADDRMQIVNTMINGYYRYFNNRVGQQSELTDLFLPMRTNFTEDQEAKALESYYQLAAQKNYEEGNLQPSFVRDEGFLRPVTHELNLDRAVGDKVK